MKLSESASHLVNRVGLAVGVALLAGVLLIVSIAVSAETAPSSAVTAPVNAELSASALAASARPSRFFETSKVSTSTDPAEAVRGAWEMARDTGVYGFATDLVQASYPARTLANSGRGPQSYESHMEGEVDQPARTLEFRLWQPGTTGSSGVGSGAEARIEGDRAYLRPAGGEWKEVEDFSSTFAPDTDPLAFLAGIKNVREVMPVEQINDPARITHHVSRFTFELDGPALATYMRDQLERQLAERGELPLNVALDAPSSFRQMTGSGELWVDGRGLPVRLTMHLAFPEQRDGARLEADVQTAFSGFPQEVAAAPNLAEDPLAWAGAALGRVTLPDGAADAGGTGGALACGLGATALLLACRRSRRWYVAVVVAVIFSMVAVPLMQDERATAFFERQAARSQDLLGVGAGAQAADEASAQEQPAGIEGNPVASWDPHQDPLAQPSSAGAAALGRGDAAARLPISASPAPAVLSSPTDLNCSQDDTSDEDADGVNKYEECVYGLLPVEDSDTDGLTDGQELNKLGTDPMRADTDGDVITDTLEVQGFNYGGRQWYLNPSNPDTNNDGLSDSVECSVLVDVANPTEDDFKNGCDSDQDGIPNPFEIDNDNDGVPDRVDLSPDQSLDSHNNRSGQATEATAFKGDQPFLLSVGGLQQDWPVLVDLQMRPVTPTHLAYTTNVLDWPAGDIDGQLQHWKGTTFKTSDNPDIANPEDDAGANGDMRLVPLLEITMTGSHVPLALTNQVVTATVRGEISATVTLTPGGANADTDLHFQFGDPWIYDVGIYNSTCPVSGSPAQTFPSIGNGRTETYSGKKLVDLADGQHAMLIKLSSGKTQVCANIPDVVNGPYSDKMVDASVLDPYGITVQDRDDGAVVAYVPLNVAPDDTGGGKSAFQAHMVYWPGDDSTWDEPQQMRIIWLVQMLTDSCNQDGFTTDKDPNTDPEGYNAALRAWCEKKEHRTMDQIVPVQIYDESWYLTGLSVREDHGLDVAVAYVNPKLATYDDDALWTLSWGLGQQFVPGRDCETRDTIYGATAPTSCKGDKRRDLSVFPTDRSNPPRPIGDSTIQERFDITSTVPSSDRYRWGIATDALRVESFRYANQDYVGYLSAQETPRILKDLDKFGTGIHPTLLFAHEERFRSADLDAAEMPSSGVLTLDVSNTADYPEQTTTGMLWAPFRYNKETGEWESYPASDYWDPLEVDLEARFKDFYDGDAIAGSAATARAYYYGLLNGVVGAVHCTPEESTCPIGDSGGTVSDEAIRSANEALGGLRHVAVEVIPEAMGLGEHVKTDSVSSDAQRNGLYVALEESLQSLRWSDADDLAVTAFNWVGQTLQGDAAAPYIVFRGGPAIPAAANLVVGGAVIALNATLFVASENLKGHEMATRAYYILYTGAGVFSTVKAAYAGYKLAKTAEGFLASAKAAMGFRNYLPNCKFGVFTTVVFIAAEWAGFVFNLATGRLAPHSVAFNEALVETIAYTVVSVVLFVIFTALGPIGDLLNGIKLLINGLVGLLCSYLPQEMQESKAADWICGGITGFLTKRLAAMFYSGTVMVDLAPDEDEGPPWYPRLNLHHFEMDLVDPEAGVVTGNAMRYSAWLTNTIDLVNVPLRRQEIFWGDQFNDDNLKSSTFGYRWQEAEEPFHDALSLGDMKNSWLKTNNGRPFYYTETVATETGFLLREAGINRPAEHLYLSEAYAIPAQQCWGYKALKYCYISTEKDTIHYDMSSGLIYDILPATLDGFYQLARKGDGWALAWGQQGDLTFPTLNDADGDGLLKTSDPNDSKWDADEDGLSDLYELNNGSDPLLADTDDDGLTDYQEAQLGTDPTSADSDGDGLYDCQEVFHQVDLAADSNARDRCGNVGAWSGGWSIVYGMQDGTPLTTLVTSNPVDVDSDADGLTDSQEKIYGYNPRAYSVLNVLSLNSSLGEVGASGVVTPSDGFVVPGQTLYYSATVKNELDNRQAEGLLWNKASPIFDNSELQPQPFNLTPQHDVNMAGNLDVLPGAASGAYSLTQVAGALITDLTVEADNALLWLPFDDPAGSTVFADHSGLVPAHDGQCVGGCTLQPADGRVGGALKLDDSGYVHSDAPVSSTGYGVSLWFKTNQDGVLFLVKSADQQNNGIELAIESTWSCPGCGHYEWLVPGLGGKGASFSGATPLNDGRWHHLVHTFGTDIGGQKVYLDGALVASEPTTAMSLSSATGVDIGGCDLSFQTNCRFSGLIDDVRLFDHGLTQPEVQKLFEMPVFEMDFDRSDGWFDVSNFPTTVSCAGADCPTHTTNVTGGAATFNGTQYLSVASASGLNLSGGRLTLSAWIYPRTRGGSDTRDTYPQAILGLHSGGNDAYPTLQRVGRKLLFGLGTGSGGAYLSATTTRNVLNENQWNHVAVTLDKEEGGRNLRFYVNGDLVEEQSFPVTAIAPTTSFEIGRSDPNASMLFSQYDQGQCLLGYTVMGCHMCMTVGGQEAWNQGGLKFGDVVSPNVSRSFIGSTQALLWEDVQNPVCGPVRSDEDPLCKFEGGSSMLSLDTDNPGFPTQEFTFSGCGGEGGLYLAYDNNAIPFYGDIDEVQIFAQPFDQDAIKRLYLDAATLLHLPLDEAPGASVFQDMSFKYVSASCNRTSASTGDSTCPASGTAGRINLAAQFDSSKQNAITLGHSAANELAGAMTVAAWIKPSSPSTVQRIVSSARTNTANGWGFGVNNSELVFTLWGTEDKYHPNPIEWSTTGAGLQPDRWYHVAVVYDPGGPSLKFYVDRVLQTSLQPEYLLAALKRDTDDQLLVGATTEPNSASPSQLFDGQIDDLWIFNMPLSTDQIRELYDAAPILHLSFEEEQGATQFADNAAYGRTGACTESDATHACPLTGEAVRGQVGLAAAFDGVDDRVAVADSAVLTPSIFTVGAWVMPVAANKTPDPTEFHELVGKWQIPSWKWPVASNFRLYMADDLKPGLEWGCSETPRQANADVALIENHWNHVMGTFDGQWLRIYVNGSEHGSYQLPIAASCTNDQPVEIGGKAGLPASEYFNGRLDEVVLYDRALTPGQIADLYDYQAAWFEDRQSRNITVDDDLPTAQVLMTGGAYLANRPILVGVTVNDATSGVEAVELGVDRASTPGVWITADACAQSAGVVAEGGGGAGWCAEFAPSGQGAYTLLARATDRVGHTGQVGARVPVYVDDMAPNLDLDSVDYELKNVAASEKKPQTWVVHLSGTVSDPAIADGVLGSGVPADGVHVTLRDAEGKALGDVGQMATISGSAWSLDYALQKAKADGCFEVEVEAVDQIARIPDLDSTQVGRHTAMLSRWAVLDASAPAVLLDQQAAIAGGQIVSTTKTLGGEASTRSEPVQVDLTTTTGADQTRVRLTCQRSSDGTWYTLFDLQAGTLQADSTQHWEGEIYQGSTCRVELTTSAQAGGVSGIVSVCSEQLPGGTWKGDFVGSKTVEFAVQSNSCAAPGCPANPQVTGVQGVDVAFRSVLPGSAFLDEVPPAGEILHLPFEDTSTSDGTLLVRDVTGLARDGYCSSGACPITGQASPSGGADLFDGVNDSVRVAQVAGQGATDYLSVAAWIYPTKRPDGSWNRGTFISRYNLWGVACTSDGLVRWFFRNTNPGWVLHSTGYLAPLNQWTHIVVVYDNGVVRTYVNGNSQPVDTYNGSGTISNANMLDVGGLPGSAEWFTGRLDDVRLFNRALTVDEIKLLYLGSGPLVALSFEKPWATDGEDVTDSSGWGHDGTLYTGTGDSANKAMSGQVGSYALQLDGTGDYVEVPLDVSETGYALALWFQTNCANCGIFSVDKGTLGAGGHDRHVYLSGGNVCTRVYSNETICTSGTNYADGKWHHVVHTFGGTVGGQKIYVDGVLKATGSKASSNFTTQDGINIGFSNDAVQHSFAGSLDELRIYSRALSAAEVGDLYRAGWQTASLTQTSTPGGTVERTSWSAAVPAGLEGSYEVEMRGWDAGGHVEAVSSSSLLWLGEADNLAPRVTLSLNTTTNQYTTVAEDYHLAETGFSTPCGASAAITREPFRSPWYLGSTGDRQKLYRLTAVCPKPAGTVTEKSTACDSFGNCATVGVTAASAQGPQRVEDSGVANAGVPDLSGQPGPQQAEDSVIAGATIPDLSGTAPPARPGNPGFEISTPAVVTTSHYYEPRTIDLVGAAIAKRSLDADWHALASVQVAIADAAGPATLSEPAAQRPYTVTWTFPWRLQQGSALPDGVSYTAVVTATDQAGRRTAVKRKLVADVVLPAPVTLTLTSNGRPVEPGAIIRETGPDLALTWTPSSDGSGLEGYQTTWRIEDAYTTTVRTSLHHPDASREAHLTAGEAQRINAGLVTRDIYGNERWQEFGSVIVDGPLTPDYITPLAPGGAGDEGWMDSGCTLLGADRRIDGTGSGWQALPLFLRTWIAQQGHATWDHRALRLAWTGANWSGDGDLFIYLDTGPGGTNSTFTPYPVGEAGTTVVLPPDLQADVLIWVQDPRTASLLRWDGNGWAVGSQLTAEQFRFDGARDGGQTDLYLPFELLGLNAGDPLGALAFAAEEPEPEIGLRIWATLPLANPVNSSRVNRRLALAPSRSTLTLRHAHRWVALSDGVCPNGTSGALPAEQHNDAVLRMTIESDPPSATASGVSGGLFWVNDPGDILGMPGVESLFGFLRPVRPPLPDGQPISYTISYRNDGSHTLKDAWLDLRAFGPLQLDSSQIKLGDIAPGGEGSRTFQGTVDRDLSSLGLAVALVRLHAATNGSDAQPLEWLVAARRVDQGAPQEMGLDAPAAVSGPESGWLSGTAYDESGVSQVELDIVGPSGKHSTLTCDAPGPAAGHWSCPWDPTAANDGVRPGDGTVYTVRIRATDRFGSPSDWSAPHTIRVDAQPPTVALAAAANAYPGRLVRGNTLPLVGTTLDNHAVGSVTVCFDDEACRTADVGAPGAASSHWSQWMIARGALDYVTKTLTIRATDSLGNSMAQALEVPVVFDNVLPVLGANQILVQVPLSSTETVLNGEVTDGGPDVAVSVRVRPPKGDVKRKAAARDRSSWWFDLPAEVPGSYTLWVDAEDLAGNVTTAGPFTVDVTCTHAAPVATRLTAEPVQGWPISLTLTVVVSNTGPEPLPAGIPVALNEGTTPIGQVATSIPLGVGESQALSLAWAPDGARDYAIGVTVGEIGNLPNGPLCVTPPTPYFTVGVRDVPLYAAWNLISPPVSPDNTAVQVVQRPIEGAYAAILGYDGGPLAYYPDRPQDSTLTTVDAGYGYWIKTIVAPTPPPSDTLGEPVTTWRVAGEILREDQPLRLASGWNLVGYQPRRALTVTTALQGIEGQYASVLGFDRTALSFYPDLDPRYNTLHRMAPAYGYWISATQAITLQYPVTSISQTIPITAMMRAEEPLRRVREAESASGVQPTYEWMNFYGLLTLPDATAAPTGTIVLAVDPQGVICGATATWEPGRYGLLACYRDDPDTSVDEGASPGDTIRLVVAEGSPPQPGSWVVGEGTWTAHGGRQQVPPGPDVDLRISKTVQPVAATPGDVITYTLVYSNAGADPATGVVISDPLPAEILAPAYQATGAVITPTAGSGTFAWWVADLAVGQGGRIVISGTVDPAVAPPITLTNTVRIISPLEVAPGDNVASVELRVLEEIEQPAARLWLPLIVR
jgi:uncharacterized repeat protein (TIGR01451 family)